MMTPTTEPGPVTRADERGFALVGVLLLLLMMSALAAALGTSGTTETFIARNTMAAAQAQVAAEAGLNHAVEIATQYIFMWKSNNCGGAGAGVDAGIAAATDTLLMGPAAGNCTIPAGTDGSLAQFLAVMGIPGDNVASGCDAGCLAIAADAAAGGYTTTASYEVLITDDDDGDMNPANDFNGTLVIQATGYAQDGTKVVLEARISPLELPAIVTDGDLSIEGNAAVNGPAGETNVHTNGSLTFSGSSSNITGNVTASEDLSCTSPCNNVQGTETPGAPTLPIPKVNAEDYQVWADFVLGSDGVLTNVATGATCTATTKVTCNNWAFNSVSGTWILNASTVTAGTYYAEAHVSISGSPGSTKSPAMLSIVATGSIDISGSPKLVPDTPELLFVTNEDLKIAGTLDLVGESVVVEGQMLVKGQFDIGGNATLDGQLIVNDEDVGTLVTANRLRGNASLTYSGTLGTGTYTVTSWRDVRDAN
jgi:hypothetical protein